MAFVKLTKNKAYFKRYQVKYRRRRECKTNYHARRKLIIQDKNKYNTPKYRLVVRRTNKRILCQVIWSTIQGDRVLASSDSSELPRYGISLGLTNYAAAYCTGLLVARRLLKGIGLDNTFAGNSKVTGEVYNAEASDDVRPFKCFLDVGLVRTTTGNRIFGALKGACDGGLYVPHNEKRFPGYRAAQEKGEEAAYDPQVHRDRIFGNHVAQYMEYLAENDPDRYKVQFGRFLAANIKPDDIEGMYEKCHAAIRDHPERLEKKPRTDIVRVREGNFVRTSKGKYRRDVPLTREQRKERVIAKIAKLAAM